jgi:hypothetical protein
MLSSLFVFSYIYQIPIICEYTISFAPRSSRMTPPSLWPVAELQRNSWAGQTHGEIFFN